MPPPLPDRYRLEVRLGRNEGFEEWLATDAILDRPVQLRILGPETPPDVREDYLEAVRRSTAVSHPHVLSVFDAAAVHGGAFAAYEWTGGTPLSHRLEAGSRVDPAEFQANATGLAAALAALHEHGVVHGRINANTIYYSLDQPAKLGGVGLPTAEASPTADVVGLVEALEQWTIGGVSRGMPLSELVDGINPAIDRILMQGVQGKLTSADLALLLDSAPPFSPGSTKSSGGSRAALWMATILTLTALALVGVGTLLSAGSETVSPVTESTAPPLTVVEEVPPTIVALTTTRATIPPAPTDGPVITVPPPELLDAPIVSTFDPFGGGGEMDHRLERLTDGDRETTWRTERYYDPLSLIKAGVGLVMTPPSTAHQLELVGITPGTTYTLSWAQAPTASLSEWSQVASGHTTSAAFSISLPRRPGGSWMIWFSELPYVGPQNYSTSIAEVRFWR